jgi:hypothetical protein
MTLVISNVIYHFRDRDHSNDSSKPQLTSHDDDDSEVNHITSVSKIDFMII